mmetsp:Transcript_49102/g.136483  ORF Transcript_49102/g.136483 Transcript_49102/m.136483 type:complete len:258 (+) Transcript_49102:377-1150(+)
MVRAAGREARLLPLCGVLVGPGLPERVGELGLGAGLQGGHDGPRIRVGGALPLRGRPGSRQRRPRPARGLLLGLHGDALPALLGLRHPVQLRHLQAGHRQRLAGGAAGLLAGEAGALGDPAPGHHLPRPLRGHGRGLHRRGGRAPPALGGWRDHPGHGLRQPHPRLRHLQHEQPPALAVAALRGVRLRLLQREQVHGGGRGAAPRRGPLRGALPERRQVGGQDAALEAAVHVRERVAPGSAPGVHQEAEPQVVRVAF